MRSVPGAVATGSCPRDLGRLEYCDPVATAPGTDLTYTGGHPGLYFTILNFAFCTSACPLTRSRERTSIE